MLHVTSERQLIKWWFVAAAFAMTLTACGGSSSASGNAPVSSPAVSTAPVASPVAKQLPDNLCNAIDVPTINSLLGINVKPGIWDGTVCTWISTSPTGGLTVGRLPEAQGASAIAAAKAKGETSITGLGSAAVGLVQTGLPAPLAPTQAFVMVDLGTALVTIHMSGPAVTMALATQVAHKLLG